MLAMNALLKTLPLLAPLAFVAACGGGSDIDDRLDVADPKVRFVHAVPPGPNVTLYRETVAQSDASNVGYRFASNYFDVSTGIATWRVNAASTNAALVETRFDSNRGNRYTLIALPGSGGVELLFIDDPYDKGLNTTEARVRSVNASFNAQNIDLYLTAAGTNLATVAPNFGAVAYKTAVPGSGADSLYVKGATYQLTITNGGTKDVIFTAPVTFGNNEDWLIMTIPDGLAPGDVKVLLVKADDPARTSVEVASQ